MPVQGPAEDSKYRRANNLIQPKNPPDKNISVNTPATTNSSAEHHESRNGWSAKIQTLLRHVFEGMSAEFCLSVLCLILAVYFSFTTSENAQAQLNRLREENTRLTRQVAQLERTKRTVDELNITLRSANAQNAQLLRTNRKLDADLRAAKVEAAKVTDELQGVKDSADKLSNENAQLRDENSRLDRELQGAKVRLANVASELQGHREDVNKLKVEIAQRRSENSILDGKLLDAKKAIARAASELQGRREDVQRLNVEIAELRGYLDDCFPLLPLSGPVGLFYNLIRRVRQVLLFFAL